ncbi:MAG: isoprenylcysteine carboxylmethyltransferase family protein [Desulfobacterales bacterium]|nr:isoprenylcysteine carboxylmethyltransferase family protein [Desulfobacterales bacterium]
MTRYAVLISLWGAWCFLHSFLIIPAVTGFVRKRFEKAYRYYRIFYNFIALVTLIPVLVYSFSIKGLPVFRWEGPFRIVQGLLVISALLLFIGGARRYDLAQLLGIRQVREDSACSILTDDCRLDTGGILGMVRHPWYAGGILIVWARNLDMAALLTSLIITGYFFIGTFLEERKLLAEFGEEYIDYQQRVSMIFPFKWVIQKLRGERDQSLKSK